MYIFTNKSLITIKFDYENQENYFLESESISVEAELSDICNHHFKSMVMGTWCQKMVL